MPIPIISATRSIISTCCASMRSCASRRRPSVEMAHCRRLPEQLDALEWDRYNTYNLTDDHFDLLEPSKFAQLSPALAAFMAEHGLEKPAGRSADRAEAAHARRSTMPSTTSRRHPGAFAHRTRAGAKRGVCQDFAHIMIAVARSWGIPARYVSGYLHHRRKDHDRSQRRRDPCLGRRLSAEPGLDRLRSHQRHHGTRTPYPRRGRPRLCRRAADARHLQGRRGKRACHRGVGGADRSARPPRGIPAHRPPAEAAAPTAVSCPRRSITSSNSSSSSGTGMQICRSVRTQLSRPSGSAFFQECSHAALRSPSSAHGGHGGNGFHRDAEEKCDLLVSYMSSCPPCANTLSTIFDLQVAADAIVAPVGSAFSKSAADKKCHPG